MALGNGVDAWRTSQLVDVKSLLVPGTNVIAIAATNTSNGASGAIAKLDLGAHQLVTDASWKASDDRAAGVDDDRLRRFVLVERVRQRELRRGTVGERQRSGQRRAARRRRPASCAAASAT